jgi:hypothetical protein
MRRSLYAVTSDPPPPPHHEEDTMCECPEPDCSDAYPDPECKTCEGAGMVTYERWLEWKKEHS